MRRFEQVMSIVRQRIEAGTAEPGQRIASVREMSALTGFSLTTVHRAYLQLEAEQAIVARPRSGFFVAPQPRKATGFPATPDRAAAVFGAPVAVTSLDRKVMATSRASGVEEFGAFLPSRSLVPTRDVAFSLRQAVRTMAERAPAPPDGEPALRGFVADRAILRGAAARADDVVITRGGLMPHTLALDAVSRPGDLILIESPSFFPVFGLLQQRNLRAVEIYSHPRTGIDPDQFEHLLSSNNVRACILMPTNHYPTGVTSSTETMRRIVASARARRVNVLENDDYGELGHGTTPGRTLLSFDPDGETVLQCGNAASLVGPDFGLGWVISRAHRAALAEQNALVSLGCGDGMLQRALALLLSRRSFDRYIREMRQTLAQRMRRGSRLIEECFPRGCAVSQPGGGFMCWVRMLRDTDSVALAKTAAAAGIGILPGPMFSVTSAFRSFMSLNLSFPWDDRSERKIRRLGELIAGGE